MSDKRYHAYCMDAFKNKLNKSTLTSAEIDDLFSRKATRFLFVADLIYRDTLSIYTTLHQW